MSPDERDRLLVKILDALPSGRRARAEALAEQALAALRASVCQVLETRGIAIADEIRDRILACDEPQTLQQWLLRALSAKAAEDVFAGGVGK